MLSKIILENTIEALQVISSDITQLITFLIIIVGIAVVVWLIMELVSSIIFRKQLSDMVQATLTNVSTSINVNTQYLTDSLIKLAQLSHAERLEHLKTNQLLVNEIFSTVKTAVAVDQIKDLVKAIESTK